MPGPEPRSLRCGSVTVRWRATPWDQRGLGVTTVEIVAIEHARAAALPAALAAVDETLTGEGVGLATGRFSVERRALLAALVDAGFAHVETSHPMVLDLAARDPARAVGRLVDVEPARPDDRDELVALARDGFAYSRFHEDPRIHPARARARYALWIADSLVNGDEVWIHRHAGAIAAVMSFRREPDHAVRLFLGGTRPGAGPIAPMFWAGVLGRLRAEGVVRVSTRISAANHGALRLHAAFGFVATATEAGCTRIYASGADVGSAPPAGGPPTERRTW